VGSGAGLNAVEKGKFLTLSGLLRPLGRPARGQSLHRLSYPGPPGCFQKMLLQMAKHFANIFVATGERVSAYCNCREL
jgi:hypothetical protein